MSDLPRDWIGIYEAIRRKLKLNPRYRDTYGLVAYNTTLRLIDACKDPHTIDVEEIDALNFEDSVNRILQRCAPRQEELHVPSDRVLEAMSKLALIDELERMIENAAERQREMGEKPDWPRVVRKVLNRYRKRYRSILEREY